MKLNFRQLSNKQCVDKTCSTLIKQRLVNDKPTVNRCYKHYKQLEAGRGHTIDTTPRKDRIAAGLPVKRY